MALCATQVGLAVTRGLRAADTHLIYAVDDAYIQIAIGRNLAEQGVWGVTSHGFSGAGSSLLWPWLLALWQRAFGLRTLAPLVLNLLAALLLLWVASVILRRHLASQTLQFIALAAMVIGIPLSLLVLVGMEHTLQTALALGFSAMAVQVGVSGDKTGRWFAALAVSAALLIAVRYDLALLLAPALVVTAPVLGLRKAVAVAAAATAPALAYAIVAWQNDWPLVPMSVLLKGPLHIIDLSKWSGVRSVIGNGWRQLTGSPPLLLCVVLSLVLLLESGRDRDARTQESRALLLIFLGAGLLHVHVDLVGWPHRHEVYLLALGLVAVMTAFGHMLTRRSPLSRTEKGVGAVLSGLMVLALAHQADSAQRIAADNIALLYRAPVQAGRFFREHPPEGPVIINDYLGTVAHFSEVPVLDLTGLTHADVGRSLLASRTVEVDIHGVRRFAAVHRAHVAFVTIVPGFNPIPPEWICVSQWSAVGPEVFLFYADSPEVAAGLRAGLTAFEAALTVPGKRGPCTQGNPPGF